MTKRIIKVVKKPGEGGFSRNTPTEYCCGQIKEMFVKGMMGITLPDQFNTLKSGKFNLPLDDGNHWGPYDINFCPWCGTELVVEK